MFDIFDPIQENFLGLGLFFIYDATMELNKISNKNVADSLTKNNKQKGSYKIFFLKEPETQSGPKIWSLSLDTPNAKVNTLNHEVMDEFEQILGELEEKGSNKEIEALILFSKKEGNFLAGADINMFQEFKTEKDAEELVAVGQRLLNRWEDLAFPTVAAVNGVALGGGLEFALGCSAIVMSDNRAAKIGLPEVLLGVIPGMGGCVRLPRKAGLATALDLILSGKTLDAKRAYKAGIIEANLPAPDFNNSVHKWVEKNLTALKSGKRLAKPPKLGGMGGFMGTLLEKTPMGRALIFKKALSTVLSKTKGQYPAPLEAIDVLKQTGGTFGPKLKAKNREQALKREAKGFGKMALSEVSKNCIRIFFLTEAIKKANGLETGKSAKTSDISSTGILGAGVMGGGIAELFARKDYPVRMKDINNQALATGIKAASELFKKSAKRRRITERESMQKLSLITPLLDYTGFQKLDIVVEAVVESMEIKKKVLKEVESNVSNACILASNTSSLSITEMQSVLSKPERMIGMHFFNPVHKMPLIEVIRGDKTSDETVTTLFNFCKKVGKMPVVVKDAPGFLVNRLLAPFLNEAVYLLSESVPIDEIDKVLSKFGMPMGAMELIDEVGVDVAAKVSRILHNAFGERMLSCNILESLIDKERLGKKSGKGVYNYSGKKSKLKRVLDNEIYSIIGVKPQFGKVSNDEIIDRCIMPMINEASRCLAEKIVEKPDDVDLGMIMGTGFPPFRGGLLRYADSLGPRLIVKKLRKYENNFGARFTPSQTILERAEKDQKFYS